MCGGCKSSGSASSASSLPAGPFVRPIAYKGTYRPSERTDGALSVNEFVSENQKCAHAICKSSDLEWIHAHGQFSLDAHGKARKWSKLEPKAARGLLCCRWCSLGAPIVEVQSPRPHRWIWCVSSAMRAMRSAIFVLAPSTKAAPCWWINAETAHGLLLRIFHHRRRVQRPRARERC